MRKRVMALISILCLFAAAARAEDLDAAVKRDFEGWRIFEQASGDINGDGAADTAAILFKPAKEEGAPGAAMLAVYVAGALHTQAPKAICVGCGGPKAAFDQPLGTLKITDKGLLEIDYQGGSREAFDDLLKFRLDKDSGKFLLIGETRTVTDTVGEEPQQTLDINYASLKMTKTFGKILRNCKLDASFRGAELSVFDYDEQHAEDIEKISEACAIE